MVGNDSFSDEQCSKAGAGDKPDGQRVEDSGAVRYGSGVLRHGVTALCGSAKAATQRGILMLLSLLLVVTLVPLGLGSQAGAEVWDTSTTAWVATGNYLDVPLDLKDQEISVTTIIPQGEDSMGLSTEACWDIYLNGSRVDGVAKADSYRLWPKGSDLASHVPTLDIVCSEQIVYLARTRGYTFHFSKTISGTAEGLNPQGPGSINYSVTYSGKATVKLNLNWVLKPDMLGAYSGSVLGPTGDNHNETFHQTNGGGDPDVYRYWQLTYTGYTVTYSDVQIAKTPSHLGETVGNNLRFPIYHSVTNQSFGSAAPVFTAHPNNLKKDGQPIHGHRWTEVGTARGGPTAGRTFGDGSTANGTITSTNTAFLGTALPNNGAAFTGIGKAQQSLRARDNSQNLPFTTDAQNPRESTTTRWITVTTDAAPTLTLSYAPDSILAGQPYAGEWTNQDVKAEVSSNLYGSFRTLLKEGAGEAAKGSSDAAAVAKTYNADTPAAGTSVSGVLVATADNTVLSAQTAARTIRVDKTNPVPGVNYRPDLPLDEAFTDTSSDALSGIQATRIAVVAKGTAKPAAGSDAWINDFAEVTVAEPGYYDIWVEAKDRAGNVAALMPLGESTLIKSRLAPSITGELADDTAPGEFVSHATDTWTNKDVRVTVSEASPEAIAGDHYFGLYRSTASVPLWLAVGYDNHVPVDYSFRAETAGINLFGVAQDGPSPIAATNFTPQSSELSERAFYTVKIDKTKPYALATYSFSTDSFTDASTDSGLVQSGVDATKTRVAVVESGSEPVEGDYVVLAAASRGTDPEKFYDAWVICYDNAGNASAAAKVFGDVSGTGKDTIEAKDFEYGLNQGELADAKAIALALVEGVYAGAGMSEATSESGGAIDPANFIVDTGELAAINDAVTSGNKGRFPLTFFTPLANPNFPGQDTQQAVTVYVTLKDQGADSYGGGPGGEGPGPGGEGGPGGPGGSGQGSQAGERIYADNFLWATDDGELSAQAAIQAAFVSLYDADGARLSDLSGVQVDSSQLAEINAAIINKDFSHTWPLTFTGPDGTLVTVEVTLFEKVASPTPPDPDVPAPPAPDHRSLGASSFALTWEARASLDADAARLLSGAKAYDSYGNPVAPSSIAVDPSATELDAIHSAPAPGPDGYRIYPLTFFTPLAN
ncbi:MAG: hypothetical protein LBP28_09155, partial [Coriobacteriales bacterium]|nr:hypothetical protein [Coriobacteriales bacterium]